MRRGASLLWTKLILIFCINTSLLPCACSKVSARSQTFVSCHGEGEIKKVLFGQALVQPLRISGGSHDRQAMSKFSSLPSVTTWLGILRRNDEQDNVATPISTFQDLRVKLDSLSGAGYTPAHKASCSGDWRDTLFVWQVMIQYRVSLYLSPSFFLSLSPLPPCQFSVLNPPLLPPK